MEILNESDIDEAKKKLKQGKKLIHQRKKFIRIADREGWLTVQHFRSDELADNDEEEKRLKRAIRSANSLKEKLFSSNRKLTNDFQNKNAVNNKPPVNDKRKMDDIVCYNCKRIGHYISHCPFTGQNREVQKLPSVEETRKR